MAIRKEVKTGSRHHQTWESNSEPDERVLQEQLKGAQNLWNSRHPAYMYDFYKKNKTKNKKNYSTM